MEYGKTTARVKGDVDEGVMWWFQEIDRGIRRRKPELERWEKNEKFEDLNQWMSSKREFEYGQGDETTINKMGAWLRTRRAVLGYNNPMPVYTSRNAGVDSTIQVPLVGPDGQPKLDDAGQVIVRDIDRAKARESLARDIISQPMFGLTQTSTRLAKAGDLAYGVLKTGYRPQFETDPEPEGEQEIPLNDDGSMDLSGYERNRIDGTLVEGEGGKSLVPRTSIPTWEDWFIDWVDHKRIIVDPDTENDEFQMRWVIEEYIRPLSDVKDDPLLKNTDDLKGTMVDDFADDEYGGQWDDPFYDDPELRDRKRRVKLYEVWDLVNERLIVLADGYGKYLRDDPAPKGIVEGPYAYYRNNETLGQFYHRPLATDLVPIAQQYNQAAQQLQRAMKNSTRKGFVVSDVMDVVNFDALKSNEDMAFVKIPKNILANRSLRDVVMNWEPGPVHESVYSNMARIERDFAEVAGLSPEASGSPKSETATAVNVMESYSGSRTEVDRVCMSECWKLIFKKLDDSIDANMTVPRAVQIQGPDGMAFTGLVDSNMIAGDFDISIDVQEMGPKNTAMENAGKVQILQIAGQAPHLFTSEALVRGWLEPYGVKDQKFVDAVVEASNMQMDMLKMQLQGAPGPVPEAGAPQTEADAISQAAAGGQVPRMSQAT